MNHYQDIDFVSLEARHTTIVLKDAFQLRPDRPHKWLQKVCIFILRKLGAFYIGERITVERHRIEASTFMERLFKQKSGIDRFFNMKPNRMLIGAEDYAELMRDKDVNQLFSFNAEYGYGKEILGLKVEVIPWMRGVLIMPPYGEKVK